ncbi:MAG TPA: hypothetical protein VGZ23_01260 [bacterium]|nr:hypothetical protein [bacterium]
MAQEDDRKHDQPADVPSPAGGDSRPHDDEPIFEEIDDATGAIIIAPARRPTPASGRPNPPVMSRAEWLKALGAAIRGQNRRGDRKRPGVRHPRRARALAEDAEGARGTGGRPDERRDKPRLGGPSRPEGEKPTPRPGDIYEIEDDTGAIIITGAGAGEHEEARAKPEVVPMGDADGKKGG